MNKLKREREVEIMYVYKDKLINRLGTQIDRQIDRYIERQIHRQINR